MFKYRVHAVRSSIAAGALTLAAGFAHAAGPDFTGMTGQIDWTTAIAAILLISGGLAGVYVVLTGSGLINSKLKSGK